LFRRDKTKFNCWLTEFAYQFGIRGKKRDFFLGLVILSVDVDFYFYVIVYNMQWV
jgi:hypothetical protein